jgi:D-xylose transport system substrate-binding protein
MSNKMIGTVLALAVSTVMVAGCGTPKGQGLTTPPVDGAVVASTDASTGDGGAQSVEIPMGAGSKACVILPDAASSARWETADRTFLTEAFTAAGVESDIQNANGDKAKFATIADQMLTEGCAVLLIVNLDSPSAAAVIAKAESQGVPVIDYDRLTLGGGATYYVSFDNVAVGTVMGEGLVKCMQANGNANGPVALLNGSPTDNNATLFKQGYQQAIEDAGYTSAADQSVPDWDNTKAGTLFEQMFTKANGNFVGVASANDGVGGAAAAVLERNGQGGKIPVTGQDATDEGLQRVLMGTQCMTVYKAVRQEADAAAALAVALISGDTAAADSAATAVTVDSETGAEVPSVLLTPQAIFPESVKDVVADGYTTAAKICTTEELKAQCTKYGVQ